MRSCIKWRIVGLFLYNRGFNVAHMIVTIMGYLLAGLHQTRGGDAYNGVPS